MNEILSQSIFFGIAITLVTYEIGLWIKQKTGKAIANPLLISVILIVAVLLLFHIDYETYANGAQYISIFLTPATVSLAVPLYRQLELLKTYPKAIFGGIIAGVLTAMVSVFALSLMFGLNHEQYVTLLPKSITTAIGMGGIFARNRKEIKSYARSVISTIRKNDKKAVIVVGTPTWSQDVDQAAADPIKGDNIMYALHFYAATHKADLRNKMTAAINKGLPVFVTEYGICDASGNGAIDKKEADRWIQTMDEYGVSYIAWNLSNKQESSSIIKSSCPKVSGFKKSELSDEGRWLYHLLRKKAGLTK